MSSSIFRIPAAAAAAVFLLSAFQPVSADIYTDEHVIEQTKEDIVKLKKLLPSKAANGVTLVDVIYSEPEKGPSPMSRGLTQSGRKTFPISRNSAGTSRTACGTSASRSARTRAPA